MAVRIVLSTIVALLVLKCSSSRPREDQHLLIQCYKRRKPMFCRVGCTKGEHAH